MLIDVFQDTICPWCRIGQKNLWSAIARWDGSNVSVRWHPFELRPDMPIDGRDFIDHMALIKGDRNVQPMFDRVCQAGDSSDLTFRFDKIQRAPNTLLSHVLMAAAPEERQTELLQAIHTAYFELGRDIGQREVLLNIAAEIGLVRVPIASKLDDPVFQADVAEQANLARSQGITAVPFFIFNDAVAVSGGQPPEIFLAAMRQAESAVVEVG